MPRKAPELTAIEVKRLEHPDGGRRNAYIAVGGVTGLYLQITPTGSKSWILRLTVGSKRRDIGLGGYPTVTLALARDKAREMRAQIEAGIDPIEQKKAIKAALIEAQRPRPSFSKALELALPTRVEAFSNKKHRDQWRSTMERYALPILGSMPVEKVDTAAILRVLTQDVLDKDGNIEGTLWKVRHETAQRLRQRIEAVLSWATVSGHRTGDNPARWAGNLKELLPSSGNTAATTHHPALAIDDLPNWFADLQKREGFGARALEFAALTAARSGEVRGATWTEINLNAALWIIPASRMKMKREHRVPLSKEALALLESLPKLEGEPLVFPSSKGGALSDMTLSATMRRIHADAVEAGGMGYLDSRSKRPAVPHGLRSTFKDWATERMNFPNEMSEVALAHRISNSVEAAYRRGDMIEKRRAMMDAWAAFLNRKLLSTAAVVRLGA